MVVLWCFSYFGSCLMSCNIFWGFFPQRLPFWVSFLPVPEWWRCNAENSKSHPLCPPDSGLFLFVFFLCRPEKKRNTTQQNSPEKNQRQVKNEHCTFIPNPQNSKNIKITTQNVKITTKSIKICKKHRKSQKNTKSKGKRPKAKSPSSQPQAYARMSGMHNLTSLATRA